MPKSEPTIETVEQELRAIAEALDIDLPSDAGYVERLTKAADFLATFNRVEKTHGWYFWSRNKYAHFIVWRDGEDSVARATVKEMPDGSFSFQVNGPCWSLFERKGTAATLDIAKEEVDYEVEKIIEEEYREEYIPPLG